MVNKERVAGQWLKGLTDKEKDDFKEYLANSTQLLSKITDMIEDRLVTLRHKEASEKLFASPNWPYQQAYLMGSIHELTQFATLFTTERD